MSKSGSTVRHARHSLRSLPTSLLIVGEQDPIVLAKPAALDRGIH
jgi:hypothetical protein